MRLPLAVLLLSIAPSAPAQRLATVGRVWSGNDTRFALAVGRGRIFVGYYDAARRLTIASRERKGGMWTYRRLDSRLGWDSHNYVALAIDSAGRLHVAANMHNDPLVYFRTTRPGDIKTLARVPVMVDARAERRMTYPVFLHDAAGRLIFKYRDGGSGNGDERYNVWNAAAGRWTSLLATPLIDGEGKRNAYPVGPVLGPDKRFHLVWVWRDTPDAATNHDLSYARSADLVHWERSDGMPLALPIRLASAEIIDPVPVHGGMINNNTAIAFDGGGDPIVTFHRFDADGNTQIYVARREAKGWHVAQASDWRGFRWDFGGGGSIESRVRVAGASPAAYGLRVPVVRDGKAIELILGAVTLARIAERPAVSFADRLTPRIAIPAGMALNVVEDESGYALAWPSRPANRDLPTPDIPAPTTLMLVEPD